MTDRRVRVLVVSPVPLVEARIGGIATFIRGFVRHAPADFAIEIVGVESGARAAPRWRRVDLEGRAIRFLPAASVPGTRRAGRVPTVGELVARTVAWRRHIPAAGRVLQFHAPATDLPFVLSRSPRIRVVHNMPADIASPGSGSTWRHLSSVLPALERWSFDRMDAVFAVNRAAAAEFAARDPRAPAGRYGFLPNWADTSLFRPPTAAARSRARERLAAELGIEAGVPWLLYAGRLDAQKNPLLLVRAFARAATAEAGRGRDSILLVVGEGSLKSEMEALAHDLGVADRIRFLGVWPHQRLAELMGAADLFLIASAFEAGPMVAYESLAAGLPVVGTPVGELQRIVQHGITGWVAAEHSPEALAEGVAVILDASRDRIAQACASSMVPFHDEAVLAPFYEAHRRLARERFG